MRSVEDKGCLNNGTPQEISSGTSCMSFEFQKNNGMNRASHHRTALGKPTPSKWDDAQKWIVNLSRGEKNQAKASPRNSNADDRRLITAVPKKDYSSGDDEGENGLNGVETKNVDSEESVWRINKPGNSSKTMVRSISVRDMGTEMTPIASQEPSRTATPIRNTTPRSRSPIASERSTPVRCANGVASVGNDQGTVSPSEVRGQAPRPSGATRLSRDGDEVNGENVVENKAIDPVPKPNPLETRAVAWDEAERAKYMAR